MSSRDALAQVARDAFIAYAQSEVYGTSGAFIDYFGEWLMLDGRALTNLAGLSGAAKTEARRRNCAFVAGERNAMRDRLVEAALAGNLPTSPALAALLPDLYEDPYDREVLDGDALRAAGASRSDGFNLDAT